MANPVETRLTMIDQLQPTCAPYAARDPGLRRLVLHEVPWLVAEVRRLLGELAREEAARLEGGEVIDALIDLFDLLLKRRKAGYALPDEVVAVLDRIDALTAEPPRWWRDGG